MNFTFQSLHRADAGVGRERSQYPLLVHLSFIPCSLSRLVRARMTIQAKASNDQGFDGEGPMANVSKLLHTTVSDESLLVNLDADTTALVAAKTKIRVHLRATFAAEAEGFFGERVSPRFLTQGSFAYKTLNDPAWPPSQQKDLDDGCYLPLSFMRGNKPSKAAETFFEFVDSALKNLAEAEGWKFVRKPTCARLQIAGDAHIDVPLYAIPDNEFIQLEKAFASRQMEAKDARKRPDTWEALPSTAVLLAHRSEDWIESDPRIIQDWFLDAIKLYGERFRRDCRFIKGWRDYAGLDQYKVTSVLLMVAIWCGYEEIRGPFLPDREDERLLRVVERLPKLIRGKVANPGFKTEDLNRIAKADRPVVAAAIDQLAAQLRETTTACLDPNLAIDQMREAFGDRVPNRPDLVGIPAATDSVSRVLSEPKRIVAAPEVGRSRSG